MLDCLVYRKTKNDWRFLGYHLMFQKNFSNTKLYAKMLKIKTSNLKAVFKSTENLLMDFSVNFVWPLTKFNY